MFNFFNKKSKETNTMAKAKISKTEKIRNLFNKGATVTWKQLRTVYDLKSPAAMVGKLRLQGMMIYENKSKRLEYLLELVHHQKRLSLLVLLKCSVNKYLTQHSFKFKGRRFGACLVYMELTKHERIIKTLFKSAKDRKMSRKVDSYEYEEVEQLIKEDEIPYAEILELFTDTSYRDWYSKRNFTDK